MSQDGNSPDFKELFKRSLAKVSELKAKLEALESERSEPIAIIGMGCRFPAGAVNPETYWEALEKGRDGIVRIPAERWKEAALPTENPAVKWAGLLPSVDTFDASFFGISPREAASLDPQQRLLLEVSWEALESAGLIPAALSDSATGVFIGLVSLDYRQLVAKKAAEALDAFDVTGNLSSTAAGRLSYSLGLMGPCMTFDTACSSSLVAVHEACASLRRRECDLALAGGVNVILDPETMFLVSRIQALSPDGRCKTFDAGANGFVRGEGCGVIILKRLSDAQAANDPISAVILGSAVNQDGRSTGLTTPNVLAQEAMLRRALQNARVLPESIGLIETHGTGTSLGDPIEIEALKEVLGAPRADGSLCYLGAVKTNLGHLEAAAGIAGLIKAVLCLGKGAVPRNLHLRTLNPRIDLDGTAFALPAQTVRWPAGPSPRRAGVSSFGLSGTNAHVILQEAPPAGAPNPGEPRARYLLPLSARTAGALREQAALYAHHFEQHQEQSLRDLCYSASLGRSSFAHRLVVQGTDREALLAALQAAAQGREVVGLSVGRIPEKQARKVVFLFPGQGGQWRGMGRELLLTQPVFRHVVEECERLMRAHCDGSLLSVLRGEGDDALLARVDVVQPAVFAMQVGLAALWQSYGVEPAGVVGHSMGEVAAAYIAGALTLESACRVICLRSQLVRRHSGGGMVLVEQSWEELRPHVQREGNQVALAALNGPRNTVLAGSRDALGKVLRGLTERGVFWKWINVDYASHSPQMDALLPELARGLRDLQASPPRRAWYSTVTGQEQKGAPSGEYWQRNLREPVQLWPVLWTLSEQGFDTVLELNPHPILLPAIEAAMEERVEALVALGTMKRDQGGTEPQLEALATLYTHGVGIRWESLYPAGGRRVALPTYPWQRQRFWIEADPSRKSGVRDHDSASTNRLLYRPVWRPSHIAVRSEQKVPGTWLLVSDERELVAQLAQALTSDGASCLCASLPELRAAASEGAPLSWKDQVQQRGPLRGAVLLFDSDASRSFRERMIDCVRSLRALLELGAAICERVWIVTQGAMAAGPQDRAASAEQAALWGLGQVFSLEHPERWGGLVDLPAADPYAQLRVLVSHLLLRDGEDRVALRPEGRLVQRLQRPAPRPAATAWRTRGTALVTGGTGWVGRLAARWLVDRGAEHVVLTSRQGQAAPGAAETADSLGALGVPVTVVAADVGDRAAMAAVIERINAELPPLRVVFHAAGVAREALIRELEDPDIASVLRPKVEGTLVLEELTRGRELDAFVCFSSISAVWGGAGLGAYAAGNAFEDAWAHKQRLHGRPAVSINWGRWNGGMVTAAVAESLAARGIREMRPEEALDALAQVLSEGADRAVIADVDWPRFRSVYEARGKRPLFAEMEGAAPEIGEVQTTEPEQPWERRLLSLPSGARHAEARQTALAAVAAVLRLPAPDVPLHHPLRELGLDSLLAVELSKRLSAAVGRKLPSTLAFDHPTVDKITSFLLSGLAPAAPARPEAGASAPSDGGAIAIIGMSCRFPGGVRSPEGLWELLKRGGDAITEVPPARWDMRAYYDPDPEKAGKTYSRWCGALSDVDQFDAAFFGIPPREAVSLDPQQRLLLEVSWEALERAGQPPDRLVGSASGVFVAIGGNDYGSLLQRGSSELDVYALTGNMTSMAAGRLSYLLGLNGPSLVVDTACSSSLVAVHLACQSLRSGECSLALAGGANLLLSPDGMVSASRLRALSPEGRCKTFDASADGFVRSEGCGIVVLKRLTDARAAGDPILAMITGSAINQDGRSNGLTAPSGPAQQAVIRAALLQAGVNPGQVGYVETHGTGTQLGDPIELQALGAVLQDTRRDGPVLVGALKSNIGHTESAAGVAGLIKAVLVLLHQEIPANLHFRTPSPHIPWAELPVRIPTEPTPWPQPEGARIAGVSSFGLSGTNAHVILTEAPAGAAVTPSDPSAETGRPLQILPLSARTARTLIAQAERYAQHLASHPEQELSDVCHSAMIGRTAMEARHAVVAGSQKEAIERLREFAEAGSASATEATTQRLSQEPRVAFLFTGQGAQYPGMGADLYKTEPVFLEVVDECAAILDPLLPIPLLSVLFPADGKESPIGQTEYTQPCLFVLEYALARLWMSWGIRPTAVLGHSIGEYAAACIAEVMSLKDALRLVRERGRLMQSLPADGQMVSVQASLAQIEQALIPFARDVSIAAVNGPEQLVLSGRREAVQTLVGQLQGRGIKTAELLVSHAFHSPLMDPILLDLFGAATTVELRAPVVPLISNLSGELAGIEVTRPDYWARHAREPVRFMQGLQTLKSLGLDSFIEIGPHPTLLGLGIGVLGEPGNRWLPSLRRGREVWPMLLESLSRLWAAGASVDWLAFDRPFPRRRVPLPTYPWLHQRHWNEAASPSVSRPAAHKTGSYRLSGSAVEVPGEILHQVVILGPSRQPYVMDHVAHQRVVVPGTFHLSVLLAVAVDRLGASAVTLRNIQFIQPLLLERDVELHIVLRPIEGRRYRFSVSTPGLVPDAAKAPAGTGRPWLDHVDGELILGGIQPKAAASLSELRNQPAESAAPEGLYSRFEQIQIKLGARWRWIDEVSLDSERSLTRMVPPAGAGEVRWEAPIHPAFLDNSVIAAMVPLLRNLSERTTVPLLPWTVAELRWFRASSGSGWIDGRLRSGSTLDDESATADMVLLGDDGEVLAEVEGFVCRRAPRDSFLRQESVTADGWLYEPAWQLAALRSEISAGGTGSWLVLSPRTSRIGASLAQRLRRRGEPCIEVEIGDSYLRTEDGTYKLNPSDPADYRRLVQEVRAESPGIRGIVHLFSLDSTPLGQTTPRSLEQDQVLGSFSVLHLIQALVGSGGSPPLHLWLVTSGAQTIDGDTGGVTLSHAPIWGLGKTIALELPELECTCIDLSAALPGEEPEEEPEKEIDSLTAEILSGSAESEVAFRSQHRYVRRLVRCHAASAQQSQPLAIRGDGSYLISGGLGALGLSAAELLVAEGARHLFLLGRRPPGALEQQAIQRFEALGARVITAQIDVSDPQSLTAFVAGFGREWPALRGVIHAAGVLRDGTWMEQDVERMKQVFSPKVYGAWNLHVLTREQPLDFFISYSSASALIGSLGQANYAAANAFLDALAHHRRRSGVCGTSIDWGPFASAGMAAKVEGLTERLAQRGISPLTLAEGQSVLLRLFKRPRTQAGVLKLDMKKFAESYPRLAATSYWSELSREIDLSQPRAGSAASLRQIVLALAPEERRARIDAHLIERLAQVLRLPSSEINRQVSLTRLGLDSLMAVELRNRLDAELQINVPTSFLMGAADLQALATYILERLPAHAEAGGDELVMEEGSV